MSNFVDFGNVALNSLCVRTFTVENVSKMKLLLGLSCSIADDVKICVISDMLNIKPIHSGNGASQRKDETAEDNHKRSRTHIDLQFNEMALSKAKSEFFRKNLQPVTKGEGQKSNTDYLDLATPVTEKKRLVAKKTMRVPESATDSKKVGSFPTFTPSSSMHSIGSSNGNIVCPEPVNISELSDNDVIRLIESKRIRIETLLALLSKYSGVLPQSFSKSSSEEKYVKIFSLLRKELNHAFANDQIRSISELTFQSGQSISLYLVYSPRQNANHHIQVCVLSTLFKT